MKIKVRLFYYIDFVLSFFPGYFGRIVRRISIKPRVKKCGKGLILGTGVTITGHDNIEFGNNVSIMSRSYLHADHAVLRFGNNVSINSNTCLDATGGEIVIGDNVLIAQNVVFRASDHGYENVDIPIIQQKSNGGKILVGDGCWIGANSVITRNVTIGEHSIVGAGAVVTKDVESFSIVGGVPARLIRKRK